ncbi:hypothetical protein [Paraburkholderia hospita]|uniref:hypothetical protein n=1 Tax=Paraburkholderia hospita TaxID=169430 RepID=UPI000DEF4469|nr:hypothetical protein [Paraburkholderia hospita]AXF05995.1 hypothetical protein CUJ88_47480 [Paraburkholderia hospita]
MWSDIPDRRSGLDAVDAYAEAVTEKVLPLFDDLKAQGKEEDKGFQEWVQSEWAEFDINDDMTFRCLNEAEDYHNTRQLLYFDAIPRQMLGLAMAGLYHLWEQLAKQIVYWALRSPQTDYESLSRQLSKADFKALEKCLDRFTWNKDGTTFEGQPFYSGLNRLRLIANVVKHGRGTAARELETIAPELFNSNENSPVQDPGAVDLLLAPEHFDAAVNSVRGFFEALPAKLARDRLPWYDR